MSLMAGFAQARCYSRRDLRPSNGKDALAVAKLPRMFSSELKAQTDGRIDRGSLKETVGETIGYLRPHDAGIRVEALGKSVIGDKGNRIQLSAALRQAGVRTMRGIQCGGRASLEAVLFLVVVGDA